MKADARAERPVYSAAFRVTMRPGVAGAGERRHRPEDLAARR